MTTYMVDIPRANDPNKAGWCHPALSFLGGWSTSAGTHFSVHTQDAYNGRAIYCIEPGIGVHSGDQYTGRGEDFWDNYPSSLNPTIPPNTIKEYIGRIMTYGWQGNASTSWMSSNPDHANQMAGYIATQLLVWETIVGERDSQFNHVDANAQGKNNVTEYISAEHPLLNNFPKATLTALDYSEVSVEKTKQVNRREIQHKRCQVLQGDVATLPFSENSFDLATAFETVYFWPGPTESFREVCRVLKPNGLFLIVNESDGTNRSDEKWLDVIEGLQIFDKAQLSNFLKDAGFSKIIVDHDETKHRLCIMAMK